jgi:hypothetical protein
MKFSKQLMYNAVAEWREHYLDYSELKKYISRLGSVRQQLRKYGAGDPAMSCSPLREVTLAIWIRGDAVCGRGASSSTASVSSPPPEEEIEVDTLHARATARIAPLRSPVEHGSWGAEAVALAPETADGAGAAPHAQMDAKFERLPSDAASAPSTGLEHHATEQERARLARVSVISAGSEDIEQRTRASVWMHAIGNEKQVPGGISAQASTAVEPRSASPGNCSESARGATRMPSGVSQVSESPGWVEDHAERLRVADMASSGGASAANDSRTRNRNTVTKNDNDNDDHDDDDDDESDDDDDDDDHIGDPGGNALRSQHSFSVTGCVPDSLRGFPSAAENAGHRDAPCPAARVPLNGAQTAPAQDEAASPSVHQDAHAAGTARAADAHVTALNLTPAMHTDTYPRPLASPLASTGDTSAAAIERRESRSARLAPALRKTASANVLYELEHGAPRHAPSDYFAAAPERSANACSSAAPPPLQLARPLPGAALREDASARRDAPGTNPGTSVGSDRASPACYPASAVRSKPVHERTPLLGEIIPPRTPPAQDRNETPPGACCNKRPPSRFQTAETTHTLAYSSPLAAPVVAVPQRSTLASRNPTMRAQPWNGALPSTPLMSSEQWAQSHREAFWRMERRFFERLHIEAVKVDAFFCAMERELERISQALAVDAEASLRRQDQQRLALLRQRYREHYVEIMELVNFIELNATGFEKILKKHDKVTGLQTKAVFQRQVLQTFTFYQAAQQTRQTDTHDDDDFDEEDDHHAGNGAPTSSGH